MFSQYKSNWDEESRKILPPSYTLREVVCSENYDRHGQDHGNNKLTKAVIYQKACVAN